MPCNIHSCMRGSGANSTGCKSGANWHISAKAHSLFSRMMRPSGQVYYTWDDVKDTIEIWQPLSHVFVFDSISLKPTLPF